MDLIAYGVHRSWILFPPFSSRLWSVVVASAAALRANDPDLFKRWLIAGVQDLGKPAVEELLWDWHAPFLSEAENDRLIAWHLGVSL
ncbi:hypothetical protein KR100_06785 [Synechococcus sp. KORDI-100]|nr:hypothetical protein KR100_06785 [Synechococcus sp. KORDI-100]